MNALRGTELRGIGLRLGGAPGKFGIEAVEHVAVVRRGAPVDGARAQEDLVVVELSFFPRGTALPRELADRKNVVAAVDPLTGAKPVVRTASLHGDRLRVAVAGAADLKAFTLGIRHAVAGLDQVEIWLTDAAADPVPPPEPPPPPDTPVLADYLHKDFNAFKRLMLDSISHQIPAMNEQNQADVGIALIEVLAFAADHLSYFQDAVATEAYLETARRRLSVRRHARLVGYRVVEGCSPRVWMHVVPTAPFGLRPGFKLATPGEDEAFATSGTKDVPPKRVFETIEPITLDPVLERLVLWSDSTGVGKVSRGDTSAYLRYKKSPIGRKQLAALKKGTVLVFEQVRDPLTWRKAAPKLRQAVRLTSNAKLRPDPFGDENAQRVAIEWHQDDALTFDLSAVCNKVKKAFSARVYGNVVAADYGEWQLVEEPAVIDSTHAIRVLAPDLAFAAPYTDADRSGPARDLTDAKPYKAVPQIWVDATSMVERLTWNARRDLLGAGPYERAFTVEVERAGAVLLRFGDGVNGWLPDSASRFDVTYRRGNGTAGHVGPETITQIAADPERLDDARLISQVSNPMASSGGVDREDVLRAKREAPLNVRRQRRCVTNADYVAIATSVRGVRAAAVKHFWTGSRPVVDVYVHADRPEKAAQMVALVDAELATHQLIGVDVVARQPRRVGIVVRLRVTVAAEANASNVDQRIAAECMSAIERRHLTLGQTIYASWFVVAAMRAPGVTDVQVERFARLPGDDRRSEGFIELDPTELAVLVDEGGVATGGRPLVVFGADRQA